MIVIATVVAIVAVARWYQKSGGVTGYQGQDADEIKRVRVQRNRGDYSH